MPEEKIEVQAYAGARDEEIPRSFRLHDDRVGIVSILARWLEESFAGRTRKRFFKVRGGDGYVHTIYYDEAEEAWFLGKTL